MVKAVLALMIAVSSCDYAQTVGKSVAKPAAAQAQSVNNAELEKIYNDDQAERTGKLQLGPGVQERDRERLKRVAALLDQGKAQTGDDFFYAAMVYQHGQTPEEYLRAHELAVLAAAKGNKGGIWLSAASLDRYLQKIGKPQVFGTQYFRKDGDPWSQEPYDRSMSDTFRAQFNVPPIAKQEEQLKKMNESKQ
jgi:hypothetical protein